MSKKQEWTEMVMAQFIREYPLEEDMPQDQRAHAEHVVKDEVQKYLSLDGAITADMAGVVCTGALTRAWGEWHEVAEDPARWHEMFADPEPEKEIVKIQLSRVTSDGVSRVLIYNKSREGMLELEATEKLVQLMGDDPKRYFWAVRRDDNWEIGDRAPEQEW